MNRIYGKFKGEHAFRAMDLSRGTPVSNLIFASLLTDEEAARFMEREAPRNPDWTFEVRKVPTAQPELDFRVENHGSVVILYALTAAARRWVDDFLPSDAQTWGRNGTVVEPRYIADILTGIREYGLEVRT